MNRRLFLSGMLVATATSAETLGRLFFSADQRAALEHQRRTGDAAGALLEDDQAVRLDGVVNSSSGRSTLWRNGRMTNDAAAARTKVGETLEPASGARTDVIAPGAVRIARPRAAP